MIIPLFNKQVIINGNMSALIDSQSQGTADAIILSSQLSWTGSSTMGSLSLQLSSDNIKFNEVANAAVSGNSGIASINFEPTGFYFAKIQYIPVSGTGTCQAWLGAKSLA